jgi:hypothetical protein
VEPMCLAPFPKEPIVAQYRSAFTNNIEGARKGREEMKREEIEQRIVEAGWNLDASFEDYLIIGHDGYRISLLAHKECWEADDNPIFELLDHAEMNTYWVHDEVPSPQHAAQLLREHGEPPEEGDPP